MGFSKKIKHDVLVKSARHCCVCHTRTGLNIEVHHIIPQHQGGSDTFDNAISLCFDCHADAGHYFDGHPKGVKLSPEELRKHRDGWFALVERNEIKESNESSIKFIKVSIDHEQCGWEPYDGNLFAFRVVKLTSLFPVLNFTFINHTEKTVILTNIILTNKRLPTGLAGSVTPLPNILRPLIRYKILLPSDNETVNTSLEDEIEVPQGRAFKFQVEIYSDSMIVFAPRNKYALSFKFGFDNERYIEIPLILLNSDRYYETLSYYACN